MSHKYFINTKKLYKYKLLSPIPTPKLINIPSSDFCSSRASPAVSTTLPSKSHPKKKKQCSPEEPCSAHTT